MNWVIKIVFFALLKFSSINTQILRDPVHWKFKSKNKKFIETKNVPQYIRKESFAFQFIFENLRWQKLAWIWEQKIILAHIISLTLLAIFFFHETELTAMSFKNCRVKQFKTI